MTVPVLQMNVGLNVAAITCNMALCWVLGLWEGA